MNRVPKFLSLIAVIVLAPFLAACGSTTTAASHRLTPLAGKSVVATQSRSASPASSQVPLCAASQLIMKYYGGGVGTGNNFGTIAVLNGSASPCIWRGGVSVVALTRQQQFMAGVPTMQARAAGILLSPHGHVVLSQSPPLGDRWGEIEVSGDARDDPKSPNELCSRTDQVTPPFWGIATLGQKFTVANSDRANAAISPSFFVGVTACHGVFNGLFVSSNY